MADWLIKMMEIYGTTEVFLTGLLMFLILFLIAFLVLLYRIRKVEGQ